MSAGHIVIVLAAGGSRRLGRPKQLLRLHGQSLLRRAVLLAVQTQPQRLLVVLGADAERMADELLGLPVEIVPNPDWSEGLASSLRAASAAAASSEAPALILGCDQPGLVSEHLFTLLALSASSRSGCAATFYCERVGIPAVVSSKLLAQAQRLHGDRGLGSALNDLPLDAIGTLPAPELAHDLDTLADCERAIAQGQLDPF